MNRALIMTLPAPSSHAAWPRRLGMAAWECCGALLVARSALATDYFVATNGNDTMNSGLSNSAPWQTIGHAMGSVSNGDTLYLAEGEFSEWVSINKAITLIGTNLYIPTNEPFSRNVTRTVIRPFGEISESAVVAIRTNGVTLRYLTINGKPIETNDFRAKIGIYSTNGPVFVDHCIVTNTSGYGILSVSCIPPPSTSSMESAVGYFGYNTIVNITHQEAGQATGIFMDRAPARCEYNAIGAITGTAARAGIYIYHCYYTSNLTTAVTVNNNWFQDCLVGVWANRPCYSGFPINISGNTVTN